MSIAAKHSLGVFAECPHCHRSIQHGFQICGSCGHTVSAAEQQALRDTLKKHVSLNFLIFIAALSIIFAGIHKFYG